MTAKTKIFEIEIVLQDVRPRVSRRVQMPGEATLAEVHEVVQAAMGWTNSHLHEFDIDGARYGLPDPDWDTGDVVDEAKVTLFRLVGPGDRLDYVYDFGDNWGHTVDAWRRSPRRSQGCGIRGAWRAAGRAHRRMWAARGAMAGSWRRWPTLPIPSTTSVPSGSGGSFDPARFDLDEVNEAMARLAWRPHDRIAAIVGASAALRIGGRDSAGGGLLSVSWRSRRWQIRAQARVSNADNVASVRS